MYLFWKEKKPYVAPKKIQLKLNLPINSEPMMSIVSQLLLQ